MSGTMSDREYNVRLEQAEERRDIREASAEVSSADPMSSADVDTKLDQYVTLHRGIKEAEGVVKLLTKHKAELEAVLLEQMTDQHRKRNGHTITKVRQLFVSCPLENRDAVVKMAGGLGINNMITVQPSSLTSLVREYLGKEWDIEAVPKELRDNLKISTDTVRLRVTKTGG